MQPVKISKYLTNNKYLIDENGNIFNAKTGKKKSPTVLNPLREKYFYHYICLSDIYNKPRRYSIHYLVAMTYLGNKDNKTKIRHKNRDTLDNRVSNLEWCY